MDFRHENGPQNPGIYSKAMLERMQVCPLASSTSSQLFYRTSSEGQARLVDVRQNRALSKCFGKSAMKLREGTFLSAGKQFLSHAYDHGRRQTRKLISEGEEFTL